MTFSLCMIVKNEEALLNRCLGSIHMLMDEIIIVDTGSTDSTKEIAAQYTDKIYDFPWENDFSAARNFAFSKANMDYIYTADADEFIDYLNRKLFFELKEILIPEVEIVQMYYATPQIYNTSSNFVREYRPKLYKRLRTFTWIDAVHETVRLDPIVFDSDIEIRHLPHGLHSKRDFDLFRSSFEKNGSLSPKLHSMFAKELFISGDEDDFLNAEDIFAYTMSQENAAEDMQREALCILAHIALLKQNTDAFFSYAFKLTREAPCSEIYYEIGTYFLGKKDYREAILWFEKAIYEANAIIDIRLCGNLPRLSLVKCCRSLAEEIKNSSPSNDELAASCLTAAESYEKEAAKWELPAVQI